MVIEHNLLAMNANRMLGINSKSRAKTTEKLSSGYKINRAADDAAGLAISEKMRRQIRGLTQGTHNIQDGISLLQIADGAMNEVHDMLHRMEELMVKAANGTNMTEDRQYIQKEVGQLLDEVDRIGDRTEFNSMKVFSPGDANVSQEFISNFLHIGANFNLKLEKMPDDKYLYPIPGVHSNSRFMDLYMQINDNNTIGFYEKNTGDCFIEMPIDNITPDGKLNGNTLDRFYGGGRYIFGFSHVGDYVYGDNTFKPSIESNKGPDVDSYLELRMYEDLSLDRETINSMLKDNITYTITINNPRGDNSKIDITGGFETFSVAEDVGENNLQKNSWWIQTGTEADDGIWVYTGSLDRKSLGLININAFTAEDAKDGITRLKKAEEILSSQRALVGAETNRLEHSYAINNNTVENTTSAESIIRDTDMAKEMVAHSNHSVLEQIGQAMLTQANQSNQGVLSLLT